ncbi:MAG: hypothetical protein KIT74_09965 [Fimbriimonadales bacterium]|nr:hypothetical protein [Fimbriimonadales bacterium]
MKRITFALMMALACATSLSAQNDSLLSYLRFRSVGPAVVGGRVIDIEAHTAQPTTVYVAAASGGLWKTTNNGTTWTPIFDNYGTVSLGDVAIAKSNPDIVWVGTGEHNNQRSCHWGDGVYKSVDGGKTFQHMGLKESLHIGRIAIDHRNPNIVYVASAGPLYRPGGERGVYKTTDGGQTWNLVLRGDNETTGFIEIQMDPKNSNVLYAGAYDRLRRPWNIRDSGVGSGIYKTTDGGKNWKKLSGGLPEGENVGRIGIDIFPKDSRIVYATIDNRTPRVGPEVYRSNDAGNTWTKVNTTSVPGGYYYSQIRVDPHNADRIYVLGVPLMRSDDGGKTYRSIANLVHVDHHALWIDPVNKGRLLLGNDGGFYISHDDAETWDFVNNLPICQFYAIGADNAVPYNIMGGFQDNGVWRGPSRTRVQSGISNQFWHNVIGGDGMYTVPDPEDPFTIYTSSQFGALVRFDQKTMTSRSIRPREQGSRWNWLTPIVVSPHNSRIVYAGSQRVHRSLDRGNTWTTISPDLSTQDATKIRGNVPHCTITKIDESPRKPGILWAGTDDGNLWVTRDGGANWAQVNQNIAGVPRHWWVSRVIASHHADGTAYVAYTGFREDDFRPLLFKTTDFGETWTSIVGNLPNEPIAVVREDRMNPNLLIVGTELGAHISIDGGNNWSRLTNGLPTTPIQDLIIHDRESDLILGSHGRGIFIADLTPLRQLSPRVMEKDVHLFRPTRALAFNYISNMFDPFQGHRRYLGENPPDGASIYYYTKGAGLEVKIEIINSLGEAIAELQGPKNAGINVVRWNLRVRAQQGRPAGVVPAGRYLVKLTAGEIVETANLHVEDWER